MLRWLGAMVAAAVAGGLLGALLVTIGVGERLASGYAGSFGTALLFAPLNEVPFRGRPEPKAD